VSLVSFFLLFYISAFIFPLYDFLHYPFAGNLLSPSQPAKPELVYTHGDKVGLTFAESGGDFNHLSGP
jgi:hypothetical protein